MHGCTPALLSNLAITLTSPAHSCTHAHPYVYTHPVLSPPPPLPPLHPCDAHLTHIFANALTSPYTCNHTYIHIPAPLCMDSCIPPVHSPSSTCPPTFTFILGYPRPTCMRSPTSTHHHPHAHTPPNLHIYFPWCHTHAPITLLFGMFSLCFILFY